MILHLGDNAVVSMKDIIAIFDMETVGQTSVNQEFIKMAMEDGLARRISQDPPKSFILAEVNKKVVLYLSPISSATLLKRSRPSGDMDFNKEKIKGEPK